MVYKRYIKRNGRTYGSYTYHNKKVDGKVVSSYLGKAENGSVNKRHAFFGIVGALSLPTPERLILSQTNFGLCKVCSNISLLFFPRTRPS